MTKQKHVFIFIIVLILFILIMNAKYLFFPERTLPVRKPEKLNVILIILDAATASHFSCYGYPSRTTPHIDDFSKQSIIFKDAYSSCVFTRGSASSYFTSLYEGAHRVTSTSLNLPLEAKTLTEVFQENGYRTASFTSSANVSYYSGLKQGFSDYYEFFESKPDEITNKILEWLKKNEDQKFFLYAHYRQPHDPFDAPDAMRIKFVPPHLKKYWNHYEIITGLYGGSNTSDAEHKEYFITQYDSNLNYGDWAVHGLLSYVLSGKLKNNTIVIVTADHGEATGDHICHGQVWYGHNCDVHKQTIWIPLIIYFPHNVKVHTINQIVENVDFLPTLIDLLQLDGAPKYMQGKSFAECFFSEKCLTKGYAFSVSTDGLYFSMIDSHYHFVLDASKMSGELYDISKDPKERFNIHDSNSRLSQYYENEIQQFISRNEKLGYVLYHSWRVKNIELSPEALENLKSLGYIK